ncbi:hypothetical protein KY317_03710, partial [Candidatus Woesearchaeota archaeon]|nr:hypothetical protein [Candidatus Woesearchaeota archaeon]
MADSSLDKLLEKTHEISRTASLENLEKAYDKLDDGSLADIVGAAYQMMLRFDKAEELFRINRNHSRMEFLLDSAIWYGRYPRVVRRITEFGKQENIPELVIDEQDYKKFLKEKALIHVPLFRDGNFFIDEEMLDWILAESDGTVDDIEKAVKGMEESGNRNVVKRKILASHSPDDGLYERCEKAYRKVLGT